MSKLSKTAAAELMSAWLSDVNCRRLSDETKAEMGGKLWFGERVRVFLARTNKLASDALWDDDILAAQRLLLKHGIADGGDKRMIKANRAYRKAREQASILSSHVTKIYAQKMNGRHWSTVK